MISRALVVFLTLGGVAHAQQAAPPVSLLDVPYISQSEALCGGAAAAMVLRYWGERGLDAESFAHLVDRSEAGIRTDALAAEIAARGWSATPVGGDEALARAELARGRPVLALIEDRPGAFHYVVVVAWHERGIVFHDPARAPFRVMPPAEFVRRWQAADAWMLVVLPGATLSRPVPGSDPLDDLTMGSDPGDGCDRLVARGVAAAQGNDLEAAERTLSAALACPGAAAARELAGVRLLQRRWPEVTTLARAATASDPTDAYSWKLLGTSLFVQDDRAAALLAWNEAGEPRVDLVRIDGLDRTRHRVVERQIGVGAGDLLTPGRLARARRRLRELPAAASARVDYAPVPGGRAELRGAVAERPLVPSAPLAFASMGLAALGRRELRASVSSPTGGGERIAAAWRFWPGRPRVALDVEAPGARGVVWTMGVDHERQPFSDAGRPPVERTTARGSMTQWATGVLRWSVHGGVERRLGVGRLGLVGGGVILASGGDRFEVTAEGARWTGGHGFATGAVSMRARSRTDRRGTIALGEVAVHGASAATPLDAWPAGDTGHARPTLLRAHPVLDDGRLSIERLGRALVGGTAEVQHWWPPGAPVRVAAALFLDAARTARRVSGPPVADADAGVGVRLGIAGVPGTVRVDVARGLRDGATAVTLTYDP